LLGVIKPAVARHCTPKHSVSQQSEKILSEVENPELDPTTLWKFTNPA